MDHVNPWVDAAEMMRLAEALLAPPLVPPRAPADAGFGGEFVGYEPHPPDNGSSQHIFQSVPLQNPVLSEIPSASAIRSETIICNDPLPSSSLLAQDPLPSHHRIAPALDSNKATESPPPPQSRIAAAAPPLTMIPPTIATPSPSLLLERLGHFRAILRQHFATRGVFLLDQHGKAIFDDSDHGKLYFMARSLAFATKTHRDEIGNVHVRVGSTTSLVVIPADTAVGKIVLGLVVDHAIPPEALPHIVTALHAAVSPPQAH